jgi:DNA polymerase-3 subunit alpha (Gram-positive type)
MGIFGYSKVVAFDLETTGLDSVYDEIIEIGAVKLFENGRIEKFNSLVSTDRPIPFFVSQLTGIDNEMILEAPGIDKVLPNFLAYCT